MRTGRTEHRSSWRPGWALLAAAALWVMPTAARAVWDITTVDPGGDVGWYASIALDTAGHPHISYYDYTNQRLKYAFFSGTAWMSETVDANSCGAGTSIAVDASDRPHIAYHAGNGDLRYVYKNAGTWTTPFVVATALYSEIASPSLRLDSNQYPNVSYVLSGNGLRFRRYNGSTWETATLVSSADDPQEHSLALDAANDPHIAHYNNSKRTYYFSGSGSPVTWSLNTPNDPGANEGPYLSLALDGAGHPHLSLARVNIVSYHVYDNDLRYYYYNGAGWTEETVDSQGDVGWFTSIAVDGAQHAHISYHDHGAWTLKYATNAGGAWAAQVVDCNGGVGYTTSLKLDAGGLPHIAYYDVTNKDLKYARWVSGTNTLSGRILEGATGKADVYVFLSGDRHAVVMTQSDGSYVFAGVPNGTYTVTPVLAGYVASPQSRTYSLTSPQTGQDYAINAGTSGIFIGGHIRDASGPLAGVRVDISGGTTGNTTTDANGYYRFINLAPGDYTVTPSLFGYVFTPTQRQFTGITGAQESQDFTGGVTNATYILGGYVRDSQNHGITGAQVNVNAVSAGNTLSAQAVTAANGYFEVAGLSLGDYRVQASCPGWVIMPASQTVPNLAQNVNTVRFSGILSAMVPAEIKVIGNLFRPNRGEYVSIWHTLPAAGNITIKIYTLDGVLVRTLVDGPRPAGLNQETWNGQNQDNQSVASGIYLVDIRLPGTRQLKKVCVLK